MKNCIKTIILLAWPLYFNDFYLITINSTSLSIMWILDAVFFLLIPSATLVVLFRLKKISLRDCGLAVRPTSTDVFAGLLFCVILIPLIQWTIYPVLNKIPGRLTAGYDFPVQQPLRAFLIVYAALSAGFLEETVYRGVVISELMKNGKSAAFAVTVSCIIFGGIHWGEGPGKIISTVLWSVLPAIWFARRKSLWAPVLCHSIYDLLVFTRMI